jgi:hypothetical protein
MSSDNSLAVLQAAGYAVDEHVVLEATAAGQSVSTLARLLVWLQQRPELLQLSSLAAADTQTVASSSSSSSAPTSHGALWLATLEGKSC